MIFSNILTLTPDDKFLPIAPRDDDSLLLMIRSSGQTNDTVTLSMSRNDANRLITALQEAVYNMEHQK